MQVHQFSRKYAIFVIVAILVSSLSYAIYKTEAQMIGDPDASYITDRMFGRPCPPFALRLRNIFIPHRPCFLDVWEGTAPEVQPEPVVAPVSPAPESSASTTEQSSLDSATSTPDDVAASSTPAGDGTAVSTSTSTTETLTTETSTTTQEAAGQDSVPVDEGTSAQ